MRIKEGKRYVDRKGRIIGPMTQTSVGAYPLFGECAGDCGWHANGKRMIGVRTPSDLVAAYVEPVSPSEISGKESTVDYDLSGIPAGYSFVGFRLVQLGDQYVSNMAETKVFVATESDVTLKKLRIIVKPTVPPEPKQRTVVIHRWLVWDAIDGKGERIVFATKQWIYDSTFSHCVDLGFYQEVKVNV